MRLNKHLLKNKQTNRYQVHVNNTLVLGSHGPKVRVTSSGNTVYILLMVVAQIKPIKSYHICVMNIQKDLSVLYYTCHWEGKDVQE